MSLPFYSFGNKFMIIIHSDELTHSDNIEDVIEHYGVVGMKWRNRRAIRKEVRQATGGLRKNLKLQKVRLKNAKAGYRLNKKVFNNTDASGRDRKYLKANQNLARKQFINEKKQYKFSKKQYKEAVKAARERAIKRLAGQPGAGIY